MLAEGNKNADRAKTEAVRRATRSTSSRVARALQVRRQPTSAVRYALQPTSKRQTNKQQRRSRVQIQICLQSSFCSSSRLQLRLAQAQTCSALQLAYNVLKANKTQAKNESKVKNQFCLSKHFARSAKQTRRKNASLRIKRQSLTVFKACVCGSCARARLAQAQSARFMNCCALGSCLAVA